MFSTVFEYFKECLLLQLSTLFVQKALNLFEDKLSAFGLFSGDIVLQVDANVAKLRSFLLDLEDLLVALLYL